jgi:uncharacterized protein YndB with AHSA1/START domain
MAVDDTLRALANPTRRAMLELVWDAERSSSEIAQAVGTGATCQQLVPAPPQEVFRWLVQPELLVRWIGIDVQREPRPGGRFRFEVTDGQWCGGRYLEVVPGRRVVVTWDGRAAPSRSRPAPPRSPSTWSSIPTARSCTSSTVIATRSRPFCGTRPTTPPGSAASAALLRPLLALAVRRSITRDLGSLKQVLEAPSSRTRRG